MGWCQNIFGANNVFNEI